MEIIKNKNAFFKNDEIVLMEFSKIPVVGKERRVVEEIRITKSVTTHNEAIRTTIKSKEVDIEKLKNLNPSG